MTHNPGLNPVTDDTLNLFGVGCCGAVSITRFGIPMESLKGLVFGRFLSYIYIYIYIYIYKKIKQKEIKMMIYYYYFKISIPL